MMTAKLRVVEFFCGIGGCAAALGNAAQTVAALDINQTALRVYGHNFTGPAINREIESLPSAACAAWAADLWWLSPPCQPYTVKGKRRDLDDPRARSLVRALELAREFRPRYLALENVPGFVGTRAHRLVRETLEGSGYRLAEQVLCPSELGWPNRRQRFYLVASQGELRPLPEKPLGSRRLAEFLDGEVDASFAIAPSMIDRYGASMHRVNASDPAAMTSCFTAAYGRSWFAAGPYLETRVGVRYFTPREILRLLGFPESFEFPPDLSALAAWGLLGNSLSLPAVRAVLRTLPEVADTWPAGPDGNVCPAFGAAANGH